MGMKHDAVQFAQVVTHDPKSAAAAVTATGAGISTVMDWVSAGVGLAASVAGLLLAVMMIRKARLEMKLLRVRLEREREGLDSDEE
jgi:hypothetical protein